MLKKKLTERPAGVITENAKNTRIVRQLQIVREIIVSEVVRVYFQNVCQDPNFSIRQAPREYLPSCALMDMSFVRTSVLEIITDGKLEERLVVNLTLMSFIQVQHFKVFKNVLKRTMER